MTFEVKTTSNRKNAKQYYVLNGQVVPRVTEVLGQIVSFDLINWMRNSTPDEIKKSSRESLSIGSNLHDLVEEVLLNGINDGMRSTPYGELLEAIEQWRLNESVEVLKTEEYLYKQVTSMGYAGRCDIIARVSGKLAILDVKTSGGTEPYESHWQQVMAYKSALERMLSLGDIKLDDVNPFDQVKEVWVLTLTKIKNEAKEIVGWEFHPHVLNIDNEPRLARIYQLQFDNLLEYWWLNNEIKQLKK